MLEDMMTVQDAANHLGISGAAVRDLIRRKRLPSVRAGKWMHLIPRADVLAYQAEHAGKQKPGPAPKGEAALALT